jgi:predicted permease
MGGVLIGFGIISVIIAIGYLVARLGVLGDGAREVLSRTAFFVASPALLFTIIAEADLQALFSNFLGIALISAAFSMLVFALIARLLFRRSFADTIVGSASSGYSNANNIGLPVATYVLGDPQYVVPVILLQLVLLAPLVLGTLDVAVRGHASVRTILSQPLRNPIIIASLLGVIVAATGIEIPAPVMAPFELIGGAAIPLMLLAFGMSLRGQRPLKAGTARKDVALASAIKLGLMPIVAWLFASFVFGLEGTDLYVAVVLAALPTAQNVYNFAVRYRSGTIVARDTILVTTVLAIPVLLLIALLLGP